VVIVQRVEAHGMLRADLRIGTEISPHESASGQVLTAFAPPDVVARFKQRGVRLASARNLARVRKNKMAVASGGVTLQGICVAAVPILDRQGHCFAALSVVGPESRFNLKRVEPAIRDAGVRLNAMFGGVGSAPLRRGRAS
jgi:DNA-binding IclR family transcriptional regulator